MSDNYINHAEEYLGFWEEIDSDACAIFSGDWRGRAEERRKGASWALQKYGIARNCGKKHERDAGKERFEPLFEAIDAVENLKGFVDPVEAVAHVRDHLKDSYRRTLSVAASKILWFKFKSPIVICDSRAMNALGLKGNRRNYEHFYPLWRERFKSEKATIAKACDKFAEANPKHKSMISKPWFRERVFDTRLWEEGKRKGK